MAGTTKDYEVDNVQIAISDAAQRKLIASWLWKEEWEKTLDHFEVVWQWKNKGETNALDDRYWHYQTNPTNISALGELPGPGRRTYSTEEFTAPDNAVQVRISILPVSTTHTVKGKKDPQSWWTGVKHTTKPLVLKAKVVPDQIDGIGEKNINIIVMPGTARKMRASWTWGKKKQTDHYVVKWERMENGTWFADPNAEHDVTVADGFDEYDAPDIATRVRVTVTPIAKTHYVDLQEVAYWTAKKTTKKYQFKADSIRNAGTVKNLRLRIQGVSGRTIYAEWDWNEEHTVSYSVKWEFLLDDNKWYEAEESTTTKKNATYSASDTTQKVRATVMPVADTHLDAVAGKEVAWWTADWCPTVEFALIADAVEDAGSVSGLSLIIQGGSTRTMAASWSWSRDHTASFTVDWDYMTEDGNWYPGADNTVTETPALYTAPDNATRVRVRVLPVAETHQDKGNEVGWWSANWSETVEYAFTADTVEDAGSVSGLMLALQPGSDRTVYASWTWSMDHTSSFSVQWAFDAGNGFWFENGEETTTSTQSTYSAPQNATRVKVQVKANSESRVSNGVTSVYWTSDWSPEAIYVFSDIPATPSAPTVTIENFNLIAEVDCNDSKTSQIEFQIVMNNATIFSTGIADVVLNHATYSCAVTAGGKYKARCRGLKDGEISDWSGYSQSVGTIPEMPSGITSCKALSDTSVELTWNPVQYADTYDIEYTTNKAYFDSSSEPQSISVNAKNVHHAVVTSLETGKEWFFRVRATNSSGSSGYCSPVSVVLGKKPAAPTTWSLASTAIVGEDIILYWVHNAEDGSSQTAAQIEITLNGSSRTVTVDTSREEQEADTVNSYVLPTSSYNEGAKVLWRVRTKGVIDEYGDWSIQRTINVYAPPTLVLAFSQTYKWIWDTFNFYTDTIYTAKGTAGGLIDVLTAFPLYIFATAGPNSQKAIGYYLTISAMETYETVDNMGETVWVNEGEEIYSKYLDGSGNNLFAVLNANDVTLENDIKYLVHCTVYMDSGLSAEAQGSFTVRWADDLYDPNAWVAVDTRALIAYISPFCLDADGNYADDVLLSVYRREFDGTFTELIKNLDHKWVTKEPMEDSYGDYIFDSSGNTIDGYDVNGRQIYITDPHPALDFARYRIVATSKKTGVSSFNDLQSYPVGEGAAVLQWNEQWHPLEATEEPTTDQEWSGTMLKLPYNLDVADTGSVDVSLINYIGREHPVAYYGTQRSFTSTWNVDIDREDSETLYLLRRLQRYAGDVYVREPSGSGYWANVNVSFSQTHCELIIPVTLEITRVEGGA